MADRRLLMESLVEELMKDQPNSQKVKKLSDALDIPYNPDVVTQMETVLRAMSPLIKKSAQPKPELER